MNLYKKLDVYARAYRLAIDLYKYANTLPKEERYGLASQIKSAAVSIPLNIAEGYGKDDTANEMKRFLKMAKGSARELEVLVDMCKDLDFMQAEAHSQYTNELQIISKMLYKLTNSIN